MTTTNSNQYQDTFIREVRATYHPTGTTPISIADPEQAAAFIRSVLSDNSREHFVALYLDGSHRIACYSIVSIGTANADPRTTRLYDRRKRKVTRNIVERISV